MKKLVQQISKYILFKFILSAIHNNFGKSYNTRHNYIVQSPHPGNIVLDNFRQNNLV